MTGFHLYLKDTIYDIRYFCETVEKEIQICHRRSIHAATIYINNLLRKKHQIAKKLNSKTNQRNSFTEPLKFK